jgi:hypothetical protein
MINENAGGGLKSTICKVIYIIVADETFYMLYYYKFAINYK